MQFYLHHQQESLILAAEHFAGGGEGNLFRIQSPSRLSKRYIAKLYHPHKLNATRSQKLEYLLAHPPADFGGGEGPPSVVWVHDLIKNQRGQIIGFIMPFVRGDKLELLASMKLPRKVDPQWHRFAFGQPKANYYRLRLCFNIAVAIQQVHATGKYVLVDLKPDNIIAQPNGIIALVDMDSVEVVEDGQSIFDAPVATPEYTPPEHYIKDQLGYDPTAEQAWDCFSLAVIFYKLLFGIHPFAGGNKAPFDHCLTLEQKIEAGLFVHAPNSDEFMAVVPPPHQAFYQLDKPLQELFIRTFVEGHHQPNMRPTAEEWCVVLLKTIDDPQLNNIFGHLLLPTTPEAIKVRRRLPLEVYPPPSYSSQEAATIIPQWYRDVQQGIHIHHPQPKPVYTYKGFKRKSNGAAVLLIGISSIIIYIGLFFNLSPLRLLDYIPGRGFIDSYVIWSLIGLIAFGIIRGTAYLNYIFSKEFQSKKKIKKLVEQAQDQFKILSTKAAGIQKQIHIGENEFPEVDTLTQVVEEKIKVYQEKQQSSNLEVERLIEEEETAYKSLHQEYLQKALEHPNLTGLSGDSLALLKMQLMEARDDSPSWKDQFESLENLLNDYKEQYKQLQEQFNKIYQQILKEVYTDFKYLQEEINSNRIAQTNKLEQRLAGDTPLEDVKKIKIDLQKQELQLAELLTEQERYAKINFKSFSKRR